MYVCMYGFVFAFYNNVSNEGIQQNYFHNTYSHLGKRVCSLQYHEYKTEIAKKNLNTRGV